MAYEFNRNRRDASFEKTKANAQGGANTDSIDLEQVTGGDIEPIVAELELPAEAGLSDTKVLTFTFKDSADNSSFAVVDPSIATTQTGASSAGCAAKTLRFRLPPGCRRYIRIEQTATATAGTLAGTYKFRLLF